MDRNRLPKDDPRIGSPLYPGNRLVTAINVLEAPSAGKLVFNFSFPISKGIYASTAIYNKHHNFKSRNGDYDYTFPAINVEV